MLTEFTPMQSALGGMMIGLSATLLMLFNGRVAGVTGVLAGLMPPHIARDWAWRAMFMIGLIASPLLYRAVFGTMPVITTVGGPMLLLVSGAIVGVGVTYGSGCTSGHGICGLARFSRRSLVATLTFMASTAATVYVVRHVMGG